MKQRGPPPWDLTASVIVAASALVLFLFPSEQLASFVEPYLFVLVLLLPGYLLSIALFPRRYDLADKGRLVVCVGADILILLLLSIGLYLSPWGLSLSSLAASAAIVALVLAVIAHFSRSALPRWNRFVPFISGSGRSHPIRNREASSSGRMVAVILVLIAAGVLSTLAYTTMNAGDMGGEAHFTEFYILGEKGEDRPIPAAAGSAAAAVVGIINREFRVVNYTLHLAQNGSILSQKEISLDHNQSWEGTVGYVLKDPGSLQRLDFLLYKEGDFSAPYTEDHLWLNVSAANVASENSSESSEDGTVTLQQTKKVVVLGAGEDTSSDRKRHSDSGEATSQVASQSASKSASKSQGKDEPEQFPLQDMESDLAKDDWQTAGQTDRQNNDALQTSSENASRETAASSSSRKVGNSSEVDASMSDVSESDTAESEIPESKEKLVATAVALEMDDPDTDNHVTGADEIDAPSHIPSQIPSQIPVPSNPEKDDQKSDVQNIDSTGNDNLAAANQEKDTSTADSSAAGNSVVDNSDVDNSDVDNSKAGDSSVASDASSSPVESSDVKAPSEDGPKSETSQTDQAAAKQGGDGKSDANDATSAGGEQSVSQEDASETSEMDTEIDSWVSTRGFSKSDQSQAYKSKNIQYVKKGDSGEGAVLGSQSKTPVRLGR